jgi:hypothetical protein
MYIPATSNSTGLTSITAIIIAPAQVLCPSAKIKDPQWQVMAAWANFPGSPDPPRYTRTIPSPDYTSVFPPSCQLYDSWTDV